MNNESKPSWHPDMFPNMPKQIDDKLVQLINEFGEWGSNFDQSAPDEVVSERAHAHSELEDSLLQSIGYPIQLHLEVLPGYLPIAIDERNPLYGVNPIISYELHRPFKSQPEYILGKASCDDYISIRSDRLKVDAMLNAVGITDNKSRLCLWRSLTNNLIQRINLSDDLDLSLKNQMKLKHRSMLSDYEQYPEAYTHWMN